MPLPKSLQIIDTGSSTATQNMTFDQHFLASCIEEEAPLLHLYEWSTQSITHGYFLKPFDFLNEIAVKENGIEIARRPTGGGITLHMADFAFSLIIPASHPGYSINALENYAFVNRLVMQLISNFTGMSQLCTLFPLNVPPNGTYSQHYCMAQPSKYDIIFDGKKVGGAAQRRTKRAFLHQGTLSLALPHEPLLTKILHHSEEVIPAMKLTTYPLLQGSVSEQNIKDARAHLKRLFCALEV